MRTPAIAVVLALASTARADAPKPIVGARIAGHSKVTPATALRLAHVELGDPVTSDQIPQLEAALMSSELFKSAHVTLEAAPDGVVMVATLDDKMSWIAAPTLYVLPSNWAIGVGYAENNLLGENKKLLLYGQLGNHTSMFFGTYLIPYFRGTPLQLRFDLYLLDHDIDEYTNPPSDPTDYSIARTSTEHFLDVGALVGWQFNWWFLVDARLRGAYVYFNNVQGGPRPEADGRDVTLQTHITADARHHLFGLTWGPYLQFIAESSLPGLDTYGYQLFQFRAYYSWKLFGAQQLELRTYQNLGRHLPFQEELTNGGVADLRGYEVDQFRGDLRSVYRVEYSVPLAHWSIFAFRVLGFWDSAYDGFHFQDLDGSRNYLPTQAPGSHWWRNDVGGGFRVYVKNVVLPLLGLDLGYGIEGHSPEFYFEVGLTDF